MRISATVHNIKKGEWNVASYWPNRFKTFTLKCSFDELDQKSNRLASYLRSHGVKQGEFVGIYMQKSVEHIIATIGILKAGAVFYSINARAKLPQVKYILSKSNTMTLFFDNNTLLNFSGVESIRNIDVQLIHYSIESMNLIHEKVFEKIREIINIHQLALLDKNQYTENCLPPIVNRDVAFALL